MNITHKKLILIITIILSGMALVASCSKQPEEKGRRKAKKASVEAKVKSIPPDTKNSFTAVRNGQYVTLNWHVDTADQTGGKTKQINIARNLTGKNTQKKVAELEPNATSYQDCLPDEYAYWYWLRLVKEDGTYQAIGPVRVDIDKAGSADYVKPEDKYKISITRTDDLATIKWDFPEDEYKEIKIIRSTRPVVVTFNNPGKGGGVVATTERKSQCVNALADPNSDYWYWVRATLKSGAIIYKGPIKAEYAKAGKK